MHYRSRLLGALIVACGFACLHGAIQLWPTGVADSALITVLRISGACLAAIFGVLNVGAGAVVFLWPPAD
jgi:hypothetical protein